MPSPAYQRVIDDIKRQIDAGDLKPGDRLPSAITLAAHYNVSRSTVDRAMLVLTHAGVVEGHAGKDRKVTGKVDRGGANGRRASGGGTRPRSD